ncbi:MAG TPA: ubiquitin-like small modifier protein 1 [Acidimicrobiales bacterium]|nr:ubiquitin-like small modifier protein 1 [Acidimicrobiales bacterium]
MPVQVNLPTVLRTHAGGARTVQTEGSTVGEVLRNLEEQYPGLSGQVIDADGKLHKFVNVYVNDDDVRYTGVMDTAVGPFDEVSILPAVAGGAGPVAAGWSAGPVSLIDLTLRSP